MKEGREDKRKDRCYQKSLVYHCISPLEVAMVTYIESDLLRHPLCLVGESSCVAVPPTLSTRLLTKLKLLWEKNINRKLGQLLPSPPPLVGDFRYKLLITIHRV